VKLRFFAKGDLLVTKPGFLPRAQGGDMPRYVGRTAGAARTFPASKDAHECDADSDEGRRLMFLTKVDSALWPADAATAAACGVSFVATEFKDGEHTPKKSSKE
jgi:hypothetical protein